MAISEDVFVEGLSGPEVVAAAMFDLRERLHAVADKVADEIEQKCLKDCNLRPSDNYPNGFSGEFITKLHLYGIDTVEVELPGKFGIPMPNLPAQTVEEEVKIPYNSDLDEVRLRSQQSQPNLEKDAEGGMNVRQKRKYTRKTAPPVPSGGNEEPLDE